MRNIDEVQGRIGRLEDSIAAIELALSRYRHAMLTIPSDDGAAYTNLLKRFTTTRRRCERCTRCTMTRSGISTPPRIARPERVGIGIFVS